jgi:hypothetical protein
MNATARKGCEGLVPKRKQKHYSYDESLDETPKLIADEPADVEEESPAEENEAIEESQVATRPEPPVFEE